MDYDFEAGPEDEVLDREIGPALSRYNHGGYFMRSAIAPLVRALLALLAALGAKTLREALARAANPVRQAIDEDDRKTAERWARMYLDAVGCEQDADDGTIAAMLPLVREARQARADALAEHSSAGWAVVAEVGKILGLREDASTKAIVDDVRRLAERLHVETKLGDALRGELDAARAEIARLKSAPVEALCSCGSGKARSVCDGRPAAVESPAQVAQGERYKALVAEHRGLAVKEVLRTITPDEAVRLVDIRAEIDRIETALTAPAPALTEEEARAWAESVEQRWWPDRAACRLQNVIARALFNASRRDIPAEVRAPEMAVTTGEKERANDERAALAETRHDAATRMRARLNAMGVPPADKDAPDSVDPRDLPPDSEEWVERAPGLSVHQPRPEPEACNVDHSDDKRSAVLGGECAKCLHRPPLHEATCTKARCDGHGQAPSGGGQ